MTSDIKNEFKNMKDNILEKFKEWILSGRNEAFEPLNRANVNAIENLKKFENIVFYKIYGGIVNFSNDEKIYNFCCDLIFVKIQKNLDLIEKIEREKNVLLKIKLIDKLEKDGALRLIWS